MRKGTKLRLGVQYLNLVGKLKPKNDRNRVNDKATKTFSGENIHPEHHFADVCKGPTYAFLLKKQFDSSARWELTQQRSNEDLKTPSLTAEYLPVPHVPHDATPNQHSKNATSRGD